MIIVKCFTRHLTLNFLNKKACNLFILLYNSMCKLGGFMSFRFIFFLSVIFSLLSLKGFAKSFSNQYTQFELPPGWECMIEGSEWVCQSDNKDRQREAIMVLAAKFRGEEDSLEQYEAYLKKDKTYQLPGGKVQKSEPKYAKSAPVNGHIWIDALHLASEVPGFYTRYLATVKEDLGVAVTFSVRKDLYSQYQGLFDNVVSTLKVFRQKKGNVGKVKLEGLGQVGQEGFDDSEFIDTNQLSDISLRKAKGKGGGGSGSTDLMLLLVLAVVGFIVFKKMKKKKEEEDEE